MIDRLTVDRIMEATNIVDVVSEFVSLKKRGVNYIGLCPFHNDTHPSFSVSPSRGICHCFTCGKGGNAVNFLMELEQMSYPEALRWLAKKYNIEIKERELSDEEKAKEGERESMLIVNEWAAQYFEHILHEDVDGIAIGLQYFRQRGFRDDIIRKFHLGFALPERSALAAEAKRKGFQPEFLTKTGLCYQKDDGSLADRFAGRAIFPWFSVSGKVIAFGGRVLDSRTKGVAQKYVNSPDSEVYHKERELYGLYQAKKAIAKEDCVYMVEGYTDVISMHQCGIENVVANSGTALSYHQIRLLHRFTSNIVLLYDGDAAGIHAALRGTDMLLKEGMHIKVLVLPDGNDPDSFARSHTADEFRKYVEDHQTDFIAFKSDVLLRGVNDPIKRSEAINSIIKSISVITDQIVRATYLHDCAQRFGINEATLIRQMNQFIRSAQDERRKEEQRQEYRQNGEQAVVRGNAEQRAAAAAGSAEAQRARAHAVSPLSQKEQSIERDLIRLVICHGEEIMTVRDADDNPVSLPVAQYIAIVLGNDDLHFQTPLYEQILQECVEHIGEDGFHAEHYFTQHPDPAISKLAAEMSVDVLSLPAAMQTESQRDAVKQDTEKLVLNFKLQVVEKRLLELRQQILDNSKDPERMKALMQEYRDMQIVRNGLAKMVGTSLVV